MSDPEKFVVLGPPGGMWRAVKKKGFSDVCRQVDGELTSIIPSITMTGCVCRDLILSLTRLAEGLTGPRGQRVRSLWVTDYYAEATEADSPGKKLDRSKSLSNCVRGTREESVHRHAVGPSFDVKQIGQFFSSSHGTRINQSASVWHARQEAHENCRITDLEMTARSSGLLCL
ncbi:unnamed protein product [Pleuronectes platessa]|uniref:Uncharacterized protein n=1 Tax=Pleuronectes platessa TaxID=8262 RepID=A0A9N7TKG7_PLEPL|nr:unnamed protein product [Pleuronectes platessa]